MRKIKLSQGKYALVDNADYNWLNLHKWFATRGHTGIWYAGRNLRLPSGKQMAVLMHREILGLTTNDGKIVDHRNRNGLNNQRHNIRVCSRSVNNRNRRGRGTSKQIGVSYNKREEKWVVRITVGTYDTELKAIRARNKACKLLFSEEK